LILLVLRVVISAELLQKNSGLTFGHICTPHWGCITLKDVFCTFVEVPFCLLWKIDGVEVLAVRRRGADAVHYTPVPLDVGRQVNVMVDWNRRWDHMQQHSGFYK